MSAVRILLADDHEIVRRGLRTLLEARSDLRVVGEAADGRDAVAQAQKLHPDIVIVDITMPGLNGLDAARQILEAEPRCEVLILTMHDSQELLQEALGAGARAYVLKSDPPTYVIDAVEALRQHSAFLSPRVSTVLLDGYPQAQLTPAPRCLSGREREILQLLAEGRSAKDAGDLLHISEKTVASHRANIMRKLNFTSLTDLVRYAIRHNLIEP